MGWQNVAIPVEARGEILNDTYWTNAPEQATTSDTFLLNATTYNSQNTADFTFGDTTNGIVADANNIIRFYLNGIEIANIDVQTAGGAYAFTIYFGINEDTQMGSIWVACRRTIYGVQYYQKWLSGMVEPIYNSNLAYNFIKQIEPPNYQWSSVPAISGKNGILHLSTLTDINDGNPVSTSDTTKFTLQEASNIKTLVGGDAVPNVSASGGGAAGSDPQYGGQAVTGKSGTQSTGYAFGQGEAPGGGGGFYGGYGGEADVSPAGAGSGYIGNSLLTNKKMYGYGVAKNTSASAYTISKSDHSIAAIEKKPKAGNGYAKITYLRPLSAPPAWDGNFFNADFSTDGRDSIRYDSSRTCSLTIDTSAMEPRTALQGQMFDCMYDEPTWTLSNGVLDTGENDNAYLGWLYDYANINNRIIPNTCTFYIDMEVNFYTLDNIELGFFTPVTYEDRYGSLHTVDREVFMFGFYPTGMPPYIEIEEISEVAERHIYNIGNTVLSMSYNEWYTVRFKVELTNGLISKITIYIDGSEVTYQEFNTSTEPIPFVCLNSNTYAEWFCRLYINRCKIRKLYIGQDIS